MHGAIKRGWTVIGTEVAAGAADAVRSQGFDVRLGELEGLALEPGSFDVVSAVEVLEHVRDPGTLVETAAQLTRPGGLLYVTTPHGRGLSARVLRTRWSVMRPPEHLQLFSIEGLRTMLTGAGLQILRLRSHAVNPWELIAVLWRDNHGRNLGGGERVASSYRLNEALYTNSAGRLTMGAINGILSLLRLGDGLKVTAVTPAEPPALP